MLRVRLGEEVRGYHDRIPMRVGRGDPEGRWPLLAGPGADKEKGETEGDVRKRKALNRVFTTSS